MNMVFIITYLLLICLMLLDDEALQGTGGEFSFQVDGKRDKMDGCRPCNLTLVVQFKIFFSFWGANLMVMYWKAPLPVYCKWRRNQLTIVNWFQKLRSWFVTGFFAPVLSSFQSGIAESFDVFSSCTSEFPGSPSSDASLEDLSLEWTPRIEESTVDYSYSIPSNERRWSSKRVGWQGIRPLLSRITFGNPPNFFGTPPWFPSGLPVTVIVVYQKLKEK